MGVGNLCRVKSAQESAGQMNPGIGVVTKTVVGVPVSSAQLVKTSRHSSTWGRTNLWMEGSFITRMVICIMRPWLRTLRSRAAHSILHMTCGQLHHVSGTVLLWDVYCYCPISTVVLMCNSNSPDTSTVSVDKTCHFCRLLIWWHLPIARSNFKLWWLNISEIQ